MSDKKDTQNGTVDWAERLRVSMNRTPDEPAAPAPAAEEDDLAALLRAQLARRTVSVEPSAYGLDTSEFEEADEETAESDGAEEVGEPDEIEESDEIEELEEIDEADEIEESEEIDETEEPDTPDESEAYDEDEDPDELPWDEDEPAYTPTDETENIPEDEPPPSPDGAIGDPRLAAAEEESFDDEALPEEAPPVETEETEKLAAETPPPARTSKPAEPVAVDPLQLGLDDILPRVETLPPVEATPQNATKPRDYTTRMKQDPHEEAVRDTELYIRLGYEEQVTRSERQDAVEEARRRADGAANRAARNETATVRARREYTNREQTPAIERAYTRARRLGVTRLCVVAVGALFGILYDYLGVIFGSVNGISYADSPLYPLLGTLWTVLICLPFLTRLGKGLKSLVDFEPTRYAVSALALLISIAHGILAIFMSRPYLYGGVALLMLTVAATTEYLTSVAEHRAFSVASSGKTAFVLTDEITAASAARSETESGERSLTAVRAGRLSDYFARTGRYNPYMGRLNYLFPVALLAAIVCAGTAILRGGTLLADGIPVFTATFLACLPAAYMMAMSLPLLRANGLLRSKGAAVIGTAAPVDYARKGRARLLIRDGDALWGLYRKEITLRDDPNAAYWRRQSARLFRLLECPLWVESPLGEDAADGLCVEVAEAEEGYVRLYLIDPEKGETSEVMMGSREALSRRGVRLPKASMERVYKKTEGSQVIYLAFDRQFRIAYSVEYRVGHTFARAVERLASMGDSAALVTYDPLVSPKLLRSEPFDSLPAVELLRPDYVEPILESRSGGVIATGRSMDLLYPYAACRRMRRVYRLSHIFAWVAILAAMALSLLTVLSGNGTILSPAAVTAWQILLTAVSVTLSLTTVTRKSLFLSAKAEKPAKGEPAEPTNNTTTKTDKDQASS